MSKKIQNTPLRKIIENAATAYADFENGFISDTTCIDRSHEYLVFVKEPKNVLALLDELEAAEKRNERALSLLSDVNTENVWEIIGRLKVVISGDYRSDAEIAADSVKGE
ncbi:hypothetical protein JTL32_10575 [Enterobacter cloacae]|nr:hypothetical protein [Enterobacter cloacae]